MAQGKGLRGHGLMPLYEFTCTRCSRTQEILCSRYGDYVRHINACECGSRDFERKPTAPSIRFRGDGWATRRAEGEE